jgi:hypothetical protein
MAAVSLFQLDPVSIFPNQLFNRFFALLHCVGRVNCNGIVMLSYVELSVVRYSLLYLPAMF